MHDGLVGHALDQLASDCGRKGVTSLSHRLDRRGVNTGLGIEHAAQTALVRVLAHQLPVRRDIRSADLEDLAALLLEVEGGDEVGDQILDRDRLRPCLDPAGGDHRPATVP